MSTAARKSLKSIASTPVYPHALELHRLLAVDDPSFTSTLLDADRAKKTNATNNTNHRALAATA